MFYKLLLTSVQITLVLGQRDAFSDFFYDLSITHFSQGRHRVLVHVCHLLMPPTKLDIVAFCSVFTDLVAMCCRCDDVITLIRLLGPTACPSETVTLWLGLFFAQKLRPNVEIWTTFVGHFRIYFGHFHDCKSDFKS